MEQKKNKLGLIIGIIAAVIAFTAVYFLYDKLSGEYTQSGLNTIITENSSNESTSCETVQDYTAPNFTVYDKSGNEVKLSDYKGKPVVLNFWATWCPYCVEEMPHFEKLYKEHDDIQFIMLNAMEETSVADKFIREKGYTFPVLFDTTGDACEKYGASSLPVTFFIDKNGDLVTYGMGMLSEENLRKGIELISE